MFWPHYLFIYSNNHTLTKCMGHFLKYYILTFIDKTTLCFKNKF